MPSDQTLFNDNSSTPQATPEQNTPAPDTSNLFADQLKAIVNENGAPKYDTMEKALEALNHSQQYIPELKSQAVKQEALINELQAKIEASQTVQDIVNKQTPPIVESPTSAPAFSEKDIEELVSKQFEQRTAQTQSNTNQSLVNQTLTTKYGANAQAEIATKAKQLGMKPSELGELAKKNPAMVLALFGEKQSGISNPSTGSIVVPATSPAVEPLKRPEKSVLSGATAKDQRDLMIKIKEEIYRKHGITG
jgi:hypothetical protein